MVAWYVAAHIAPDPPAETSGCMGKIGYPNRQLAIMARAKLKQRQYLNAPLDLYCCVRCGKYHLGRNPKAKGR